MDVAEAASWLLAPSPRVQGLQRPGLHSQDWPEMQNRVLHLGTQSSSKASLQRGGTLGLWSLTCIWAQKRKCFPEGKNTDSRA